MKQDESKSKATVVVVDFKHYKLKSAAHEYVRLLANYGVECASIWSMDQVTSGQEEKLFKHFVRQEMRKSGFVMRRDDAC